MANTPKGFTKGIAVQNETDRSKQLLIDVDNAASSGTSTTIKSNQTLNRTLTLPNVSGELVEKDAAQTLTNKTIDGDVNTVQDLALSSLKTELADADKFVSRDVSGQVVAVKAVPVGTVVGNSDSQTLTNKTIDADSNTITNIENADIKVGAAIAATKISSGNVDNTEFDYLNGVTSPIQTQLDAKAEILGATDNRLVRTDGSTDIQQSGVTVDDSNNITGVNDLTVDGNLTVNGTTTTVNTATLDVEDQNITVNFGGNDATGEGAGLTIDRTGTSGSLVYEDALASKFKAGALGSEIQLANVSSVQSLTNKNLKSNTNLLTGAKANTFERETGNQQIVTIPDVSTGDTFVTQAHSQVLTNKDIDGGTASNTSRLTVPKDTLANLLTLTRKEGTILYATDTDKFYRDDGTNLQEIGSGSGERNFITNGDAEAGTTGWATYADAAATRPVDGTGGSPSVTFTRSTSSPLEGQGSFLFTKDAVNRQGQGASYDFTIDSAYKAKVLTIEMDYIVNSGTFVAGSTSTDSDLIAYIYDVTNSILIEPSSIKLLSNSTTISDKFRASFQTSATGTNYRLILHCATTSASAYVLKIDNIKVSPSNYVYGTPSADFGTQAWTVTNATATSSFRVTREGRRVYIDGTISFTGAATGQIGLTIPSAYAADMTVYDTVSVSVPIGFTRFLDVSPGSVYDSVLQLNSASSITTAAEVTSSAHLGPQGTSATVPHTWASGDKIYIQASWIVAGFSASTQMSDQTDTRVVGMLSTASSAASMGTLSSTPSITIFNTISSDTHGAYNSSTGIYTAPVSGYYDVSSSVTVAGSGVSSNQITVSLYNNTTSTTILSSAYVYPLAHSNNTFVPFSAKSVFLNAGTQVSMRTSSGATTPVYVTSATTNYFSVSRVSGPSAIAASEKIYAEYTTFAGQAMTAGADTRINYGTKVNDSHGAVTVGASWVFTSPRPDVYEVEASFAPSAQAVASQKILSIYKNGIQYRRLVRDRNNGAGVDDQPAVSSTSLFLLAGETIDFRGFLTTAQNLTASGLDNWVTIKSHGGV